MKSHYRYFIHKVICAIILGLYGCLAVPYILSTFGIITESVVPLFKHILPLQDFGNVALF